MRPALWMNDKPLSSKEPVIFKVIRHVIQNSFIVLQRTSGMTKTTSAFSIAEGFIANRLETLNFYKTFVHIWWSPFFSLFFFFIEFFFVWNFCDHSLPHRFLSISPNIVKRQNGRQSEVSMYAILIIYLLPINFKVWVEEKRLLS